MEFIMHPSSIWIGLITLVVLEIILGIDNLVLIAILSNRLPPKTRDKARLSGLCLALIMRLGLLFMISWMVTLTKPLFVIADFTFSGRTLIMLLGGIFLLFKATIELHEHLENRLYKRSHGKEYSRFWVIVLQIVILDVIFSLDAVITAVGMVNHLPIMIAAVIIVMVLMLLASKPLTQFVNKHPTVVVLCLSFLLMIGLSLIAEGLNFHVPKGYLYTAIGFSILIELFNQIARRNVTRQQNDHPLRTSMDDTIHRLFDDHHQANFHLSIDNNASMPAKSSFDDKKYYNTSSILSLLSSLSLNEIMIPRGKIDWINVNCRPMTIRQKLISSPHSIYPVCRGKLDEIIGVVHARETLFVIEKGGSIEELATYSQATVISDRFNVINMLEVLCQSQKNLIVVSNESGLVQGLITPMNILEATAIKFLDIEKTLEIITNDNSWLIKGNMDLHAFSRTLELDNVVDNYCKDIKTVSEFVIAVSGQIPNPGDVIKLPPLKIVIIKANDYRIDLVRIIKDQFVFKENIPSS